MPTVVKVVTAEWLGSKQLGSLALQTAPETVWHFLAVRKWIIDTLPNYLGNVGRDNGVWITLAFWLDVHYVVDFPRPTCSLRYLRREKKASSTNKPRFWGWLFPDMCKNKFVPKLRSVSFLMSTLHARRINETGRLPGLMKGFRTWMNIPCYSESEVLLSLWRTVHQR